MKRSVAEYQTLVFDCDGVVLNSNHVKTNAFYKATLPYGENAANAFVKYHTENGGVSRYKKFAYFLDAIVPNVEGPGLDELLERYAAEVVDGLLTCDVAEGLDELRKQTSDSRWLIVSGGDQDELRLVFEKRGLASLFDGGIFGSPTPKKDILDRELANGNIQQHALFIGDSKYDYESAKHAGLDFVFLSGWSEVDSWQSWVIDNNHSEFTSVKALQGVL
ncbi:HAD-IA family hydrolase [Idiomarina sp.]|uniref:HAD family hydrolase n=1 Tax=Idiomarina sp. TaxID=1874361 RepID=UPI002604AA7F|nr:HAD-IA family hydrolase [Idiomarina sp.]